MLSELNPTAWQAGHQWLRLLHCAALQPKPGRTCESKLPSVCKHHVEDGDKLALVVTADSHQLCLGLRVRVLQELIDHNADGNQLCCGACQEEPAQTGQGTDLLSGEEAAIADNPQQKHETL